MSIEGNIVAAKDLDAIFWETIAGIPAYTVADVEVAPVDFDHVEFLNVLLKPTALPTSNKQSIDLACDALYDKDATLF